MASKSIGSLYAELSVKDKMTNQLHKAEKSLNSFATKAVGKFSGMAAGALSVGAVGAGLWKSVDAASDLAEVQSKTNVVFGESAKIMEAWSDKSAIAFGISKTGALDAASTIGTMFAAMGMTQEKSAGMAKSMVELAADLASFNNTSTDDAIGAIGAALRGEAEPIRRYGVLLDDATLKAKALTMGLYDGKGALSPASKAMAAYGVILDQTKTAQGDFAKTSDGLANSQRQIKALLSDASVEIGKGMLPAIQDLGNSLKQVNFAEIGGTIGVLAKAAIEAGKAFGDFGDVIIKYHPAFKVIENMGFNSNQKNAPIVDTSGNSWEKIVADKTEKPPEEKRNLFAEKEAARDKRIAQLEELASKAKYGIPDMLKAPGLDLTTKFSPEMLLHDPARPEKVQDFAPSRSFSQENVGDEYIKRGLSLGNTTTGADRLQEKQTKFLEEIRDTLKKPPINKPLTF